MKIFAQFPGQGSQKVGMGKALFEASPLAQKLFSIADESLGFPLSKICFEGPADKLTLTEITQPAILTVSVICYRLFQEGGLQKGDHQVVAAAGHSLGEYSALVAAEAISFEDAVVLVHKRGRYMQTAVPAGVGKMAAVLGKEPAEIEAALAKVTKGVAEIANINAPGQVVIAGQKEAIDEAIALMAGSKTIELPVSAPFHCSLMQPAQDALAKELATLSIKKAKFPVFANYSAEAVSEPEAIREALRKQVTGKVRWIDCVSNAITHTTPDIAVEFGAGAVLAGMLKRINPAVKRANVESTESALATVA